jgi:hypothetical protein
MKNLLTGTARPVTNTTERAREYFKHHPFDPPVQAARKNFKTRMRGPKAAAEEKVRDEDALAATGTDEGAATEDEAEEQ